MGSLALIPQGDIARGRIQSTPKNESATGRTPDKIDAAIALLVGECG
jgi:hypothetical protein